MKLHVLLSPGQFIHFPAARSLRRPHQVSDDSAMRASLGDERVAEGHNLLIGADTHQPFLK